MTPDSPGASLPIRRLEPTDLGGCLTLAGKRQWLPEESKWRFLLNVGVGFGIDDPAGGLAGAVVVTCYEGGLAAVGMLLVSPRFGRRGLGRRLMQAALDRAGAATVFLYATAEGRRLYEALGFREVARVVKYAGEFRRGSPGPGRAVRPVTASDLPEVARLDEVAFGAGRERLLARLDELAAGLYVAVAADGLTGYGAAWPSLDRTVIGPLIAVDDIVAEALLDELARQAGGMLTMDIPADCARLARWATSHGLRDVGDAALMVAGGRRLPGARSRVFAPLMQALG